MLAATDRLELLYHQSNIRSNGMTQYKEKVTLSGKYCPARGVMLGCYGCYANGWRFDSCFANFHFVFFFAFFPGVLRCYL